MAVGGTDVAVAVEVATDAEAFGVGDAIWITLHPPIRTARIAAATAIIQQLMVISDLLLDEVNGCGISRADALKGRLK